MKNKIIKLLIFLVSIFIGINSVDAITYIKANNNEPRYLLEYKYGSTYRRPESDSTIYFNSPGVTYNGEDYNIVQYEIYKKDSDSDRGIAYCLDPNLNGGRGYEHIVYRYSTDDDVGIGVKLHDIGIQTILQYGQNQYNSTVPDELWEMCESKIEKTNITRSEYYNITSLAIRAWTIGLYGWGNGIDEAHNEGLTLAEARLSYQWMREYENPEYIKEIAIESHCSSEDNVDECVKKHSDTNYENSTLYQNDSGAVLTFDGSEKAQATYYLSRALFYKAIEAAYNYKINNGAVNSSSISHSELNTIINNKTSAVYTIKFTTNDLPEGSVINQIKYECSNCERNGIRLAKVFANDTEITSNYQSVNLINYLDDKGEVVLKFEFSKEEVMDCSNVQVKFQWYQNIPGVENWRASFLRFVRDVGDFQRFVAIEKVSDETPTLTATINCQDIICETEIEKPICVEEDANVPSDVDNVAVIRTDEKIKYCILEKSDDAENTYQLSETNGGVENDYCKVFCKEDYANIQFNPVVKDVKCGTYFKLSAHIEGTKDCYTGGSKSNDYAINKDQFKEDIKQAQEDMIAAYNEYIRWRDAYDIIHKAIENNTTTSTLGNGNYYSYESQTNDCPCCDPDDHSCVEKNNCACECGTISDDACPSFSISGTTTTYGYEIIGTDSNGIVKISKSKVLDYSFADDGGDNASAGCGNSCTAGKPKTLLDNLKSQKLNVAEQKLNEALDRYNEIIKEYNSCTTGWTNDFKFDQKIKYEYEDEGNYYSLLDDDQKYLVEDGDLETTEEIEICKTTTNQNYQCSSDSIKISGPVSEPNGLYNYSSSYEDAFENIKFTKCDIYGCRPDTDNYVSQATFVRKSVEKKQDYKTPNSFYQDSHMGRIDTDYNYNGTEIQHSYIPQGGLPVSKGTEGGGEFRLLIQDLGEFYDTGESGRLMDYAGDKESSSVAHALLKEDPEGFNGGYSCNYTSSCRHDCPDCNFECEGDGDDFNCELKECPECTIVCINCLFNQNELQLSAKTISTTNFNSANRKFGYNWITSSSLASLSLLNQKASLTIEQIEAANETIYGDGVDEETNMSNLGFSITLTPEVIRYILDHNDNIENKAIGGYADDSLTCYDYLFEGETYKNIVCYSDFIDELIDEFGSDSNVNITIPNRVDKNSRDENAVGNYWVFWKDFDPNTIDSVIGGPAWR